MMPNIGYFGKGYDVFFGNPQSENGDQGYRRSVFDYSTTDESKTSEDGFYYLPVGVEALLCVACNQVAEVSYYSTTTGYWEDIQKKFSESAGFKADGFGAAFTGSAQWSDMHGYLETDINVVASTSLQCTAYCVSANSGSAGTLPELDSDFEDYVINLPTTYDKAEYEEFVHHYGTHYLENAKFGALYGVQYTMTKDDYTGLTESGVNVGSLVSAEAYGVDVSQSLNYQQNEADLEKFNDAVIETFKYSVGAPFPVDSSDFASKWEVSTQQYPAPIDLSLKPLTNLINSRFFPSLSSSTLSSIQNNLHTYYISYCNDLNNENELVGVSTSDCTVIPSREPPPPVGCRLCSSCGGDYSSFQGAALHIGDWGPYNMYGSSCGGSYIRRTDVPELCCNPESSSLQNSGCTLCVKSCGGQYPNNLGIRLNEGDYGNWKTRSSGCNGDVSYQSNEETYLCCKSKKNVCRWCENGCGDGMTEAGRRLNQDDFGPYKVTTASTCTNTIEGVVSSQETWNEVVLCCSTD